MKKHFDSSLAVSELVLTVIAAISIIKSSNFEFKILGMLLIIISMNINQLIIKNQRE